nr:immunoglobulin heavy chain junction region [Macaca mulatta]MOX97123.1 immunoglobulin heavy chain junction region [Macaca mulatta]
CAGFSGWYRMIFDYW